MTPERARELLGGLATGILTAEERQTLFEAALHDQVLFNEVADELEFAAFLQSPETRAQLANRIDVGPAQAEAGRRRWWTLSPRWLALSGVLAATTVLTVVLWHRPAVNMREAAVPNAPAPSAASSETAPGVAGDKTEAAPAQPAKAKPRQAMPPPVRQEAPTQNVAPFNSTGAGPVNGAPVNSPVSGNQYASVPSPKPVPKTSPASEPMAVGGAVSRPMAAPVPREAPMGAATPAPPSPAPQSPATSAGVTTASLEGSVHDPSGAAVSHASIAIVNTVTNTTTRTVSDAAGRFTAPSLAPGPYTVTAEAPGFSDEKRAGIILAANQPTRLDIPLRVGAVSQTVEVTESANSLQANQVNATRQLAVLDFVNGSSQSQQSGQQAADFLSTQLGGTGQFHVIDRDKVQQAAQGQSQSQSRPPSAKQAADLGRTLGADAVIVGTVKAPPANGNSSKANSTVAVTAQVIDIKKGRALAKVTANDTSLQGATNRVGLALESQLAVPLEGAVTSVDQNTVSVTFKAPAAPRIGARFDVYRGKRKIGELTLTSAYGLSGAGKFDGAGPPRAGDRVTSSR